MTVSEQLRNAIEAMIARGVTLYRIAKGSDVNWSALQRFVIDERKELRTGTVDRLCKYLTLELRLKKQAPKKRGTASKQRRKNP